MTTFDFVDQVLTWYKNNDIVIGDPEEGEWEDAHHPVPMCKGGHLTVKMLKQHHAAHNVWQSEEIGHPCVYGWEGNFLSGNLLNLFNKWYIESRRMGGRASHSNRTADGKSVKALEQLRILHSQKMPDGRSVVAVRAGTAAAEKLNSEKNQEGKSVNAVRGASAAHETKNEEGKSITAVKGGTVGGVRGSQITNSQKWKCLTTGFISTAGPLTRYQKARGLPLLRERVYT